MLTVEKFPFDENRNPKAKKGYKSRPAVVVGITADGEAIVSEVIVSMMTKSIDSNTSNDAYNYILGTVYVDKGILRYPSMVKCNKIARIHNDSQFVKRNEQLFDDDVDGIVDRYMKAARTGNLIDCGDAG